MERISYLDLKINSFIKIKFINGAKDIQINQESLYSNPVETNFCINAEIKTIVDR